MPESPDEPTRAIGPDTNAPTVACGGLVPVHTPDILKPAPIPAPDIPGYVIESELGRGGMGIVYRARQTALNRTVALKVILAGQFAPTDDLVRFVAEAETAARLHHQGIVQIYESGRHVGLPYFSMEYVDGGSLAARLRAGPVPIVEAGRIALWLAEAVGHAHAAGVVHRDLKPANILLAIAECGDRGGELKPDGSSSPGSSLSAFHTPNSAILPKITDFGLAKRIGAGAGLTHTGAVLGTPSYMAPEQARGDNEGVGPAADIYSLGAILYEMAVGRPPFPHDKAAQTLSLVLNTPPPSPRSVNAAVPRDLETIALKCLEKDPRRRYPTAGELADDLRRFLEGRSIRARRASPVERLRRWARRNPAVAALLTAVFVSLAAGTAVSTALAIRSAAHADRADASARDAELKAREAADSAARADREAAEARAHAASEARAKDEADAAREETRRQFVRLNIATGVNALDRDDLGTALLWFTRAWMNDAVDPGQEHSHRLRVGSVVARLPRLVGFCGHSRPVVDVAVRADGNRVATRTTGDGAFLWDPFASRVVAALPHPGKVRHVVFSDDGRLLLTCGDDGVVRRWDGETGAAAGADLPHPARVTFAAFDRTGRRVVTACADKKVRVWDLDTGAVVGPALDCRGVPRYVAFNPADGSSVLASEEADLVWVWQFPGGTPLPQPIPHQCIIPGMYDPVPDVGKLVQPAFSPNGRLVVTYHGGLRVSDAVTGKTLWAKSVPGAAIGNKSFTFGPDGQTLLLTVGSGTLLLPLATGKPESPGFTHPRECRVGGFRSDGKLIATWSTGGLVHVWDPATGQPVREPIQHAAEVCQLRFGPRGDILFVGCHDGTVRVWDVSPAAGPVPYDFTCGRANRFGVLDLLGVRRTFSPDGATELRFGRGVTTRLGNRGSVAADGPELAHPNVTLAQFSPDGRVILTAGEGTPPTARVWRADGLPVGAAVALAGTAREFHFTGDGRRCFVVTSNGYGHLIDTTTGAAVGEPVRGVPPTSDEENPGFGRLSINGCAISPDGSRVMLGGYTVAFVVNLVTGERREFYPHRGFVATGDFAADGRQILTASSDTTARLWDAVTGEPLGPPLRHPTFVRRAALAPDGRWCVTLDARSRVRVWDARTGDLLTTPFTAPSAPDGAGGGAVWFSADGQRVVLRLRNGPAVQWGLPGFGLPAEQVEPLVRLLTGRVIEADGGISPVPTGAIYRDPARYRRAFLASSGRAE